MLLLAGQQPFDALAETQGDPQQHRCPNLALAFLVTRQLPLADPELPGKVCLLRVKAPQLA